MVIISYLHSQIYHSPPTPLAVYHSLSVSVIPAKYVKSSVLVMVPNGPEGVEVTCTVGWEVLVLCGCWNVGIDRLSAEQQG
jgi:ribulose-5-phosphate 4-epimerase/fuculose-1-phosphate aldolase